MNLIFRESLFLADVLTKENLTSFHGSLRAIVAIRIENPHRELNWESREHAIGQLWQLLAVNM